MSSSIRDLEVVLPSMGEGVHEATLVAWLKKPGDSVAKDEPILEVSTDKVDTEILAPEAGFLIATFLQPGQIAQVHQLLAQISQDPKATPLVPPKAADIHVLQKGGRSTTAPRSTFVPPPTQNGNRVSLSPSTYAGFVRASPLARKQARDYGISLGRVLGTGPHGKITSEDLLRHVEDAMPQGISTSYTEAPLLAPLQTEEREGKEYLEGVEVERVKMSVIRRKTAEHMVHSVRTSPHVTTTFAIDLHQAKAYKAAHEAECLTAHGGKFFLYAALQAIKAYPHTNASLDGEDILLKSTINLGCAVAIESGLIVPVIKKANDMNLFQLAAALQDIVTRARNKKLKPDDVQGGTFSVTNPGLYGSLHSQPILNQPQVAIMSVGALQETPVVLDGQIVIRPICQVGLTFDHRLLDGEIGAKFLQKVKQTLESL